VTHAEKPSAKKAAPQDSSASEDHGPQARNAQNSGAQDRRS